MKRLLFIMCVVFALHACNNDYTPKPKGYFRIDLPEKNYSRISESTPYSFEIPQYAQFKLRKAYNPDEKYWADITFKSMKAKVHLSYKKVKGNLDEYTNDSRGFVYKHTIKADAIGEMAYSNEEEKVFGTLYEIKGDAASNVQFYLTDSASNFVRGALYFDVVPNKDSLAPVLTFISEDVKHLIETFKWEKCQ